MDYSATASYLVVYLPDFESPPGHCTVRELEQELRLLFLQLYGERCIWPTKSTKWVQLYCLEESLKTDFVYNIFQDKHHNAYYISSTVKSRTAEKVFSHLNLHSTKKRQENTPVHKQKLPKKTHDFLNLHVMNIDYCKYLMCVFFS